MPRSLKAALLAAVLPLMLAPATARAAACPGADPCPYTAMASIGKTTGGILRFPQAAAIGPDGSLYVADQFSHAIQKFAPNGTFAGAYGGPGQLGAVGGVAVGADGTVYAVNSNNTVVRFAANGTPLGSFGSAGSAPGQFNFGAGGGNDAGAGGGIAVANGMVYVADTRNDRIQRFAADGTHPVVIVPPGRLSRPQGLAVHGQRLVVADDDHHRLVVFDTGGHFIKAVGDGEGPKPGQLQNPYDVAIDPQGRIYVADNSNHRVVRYGPAPGYTYRARWGGFGTAAGELEYPRGITADAQGRSYVADPGNNRVDVFDSGGASLGAIGSSGRVSGQFIAPVGVGADASGLRAVTDTVNGRVELLNPDGSVAAVFGSPAPGPTILPDPVAVAFDTAGNAFVLDQQRSRIIEFNRAGKIVRTIGSQGSGAGQMLAPSALSIDNAGTIYVADTGNGRVVRFATGGSYLGSWGDFRKIVGIAAAPDGSRVYSVDAGTDHVYVQTGTGADIADFGGAGTKAGRFKHPGQVALDAAGDVWVADSGNDRVQAFAPDGTLITVFGQPGTADGQFESPGGIAVACNGLVTVTDTGNNRVEQFQAGPATPCAALPAVQNPPPPKLATQPAPLPPVLTVALTRTSGILADRQLPLRVRCDVPCKIAVSAKLTPRAGKSRPSVALTSPSQSLAAGRTVTLRPRLSVAGLHKLKKALKGRRGLVASVRVVATTSNSAPATFTTTANVTG